MDAAELLKHDHRMVEQLFRDYDAAHSDEQRRVDRQLAEHMAVKKTLASLDALALGDSGEGHLVQSLAGETSEHIEHEETRFLRAVYDRLRDRLQGRPRT